MIRYRDGREERSQNNQDKLIAVLYGSRLGRFMLRPLVSPIVSKAAGKFLSSRLSVPLIKPFIRKNGIDMSQFEETGYRSYNEFFSRQIKAEMRPVDMREHILIAPCDSKLTVMPVTQEGRFVLKNTFYTVKSLLQNEELAENMKAVLRWFSA